ncbi:hypothetical protein RDABS01_005121, partial [Bienertia sinuspersici]
MDRSWMNHNGVKDRQKPEYIAGVNEFLYFSFTGKSDETMLKCPCLNCRLVLSQNLYGINPTYNPWDSHGESIQETGNDEEGYIGEVLDNGSDEMPLDDMAPFGKYDLPENVTGADVTEDLSFQCSMLYKNWRFRLKEQHFRNKSIADAINTRPNTIDVDKWTWLVCEYWNAEKQKRISKVNTENKLKQTETPANGARSTARIFHDLINEPPTQPTQELDESSEPHETQQDPLYITLFEKTKKHKGSGWEPNAEKDYEALKRLHEKEIEKHEEDTLSVKDAYMEVFKQMSGYVKGLGRGAHDATAREASLASEIETLKASNDELKTSNEELIASNDELKATVSRINVEAIKREKKLRDDMMKMFEQM